MARTIVGQVVSNAGDKTISLKIDTRKTHPIYRKQYTRSKKLSAHDEKNEARVGDIVEVQEATPIAKSKRFTLSKVLERQQKLEGEE